MCLRYGTIPELSTSCEHRPGSTSTNPAKYPSDYLSISFTDEPRAPSNPCFFVSSPFLLLSLSLSLASRRFLLVVTQPVSCTVSANPSRGLRPGLLPDRPAHTCLSTYLRYLAYLSYRNRAYGSHPSQITCLNTSRVSSNGCDIAVSYPIRNAFFSHSMRCINLND